MKIYREGIDPSKYDSSRPVTEVLSKDTLKVCKLLAIKPDELLVREPKDFASPGEKVSE